MHSTPPSRNWRFPANGGGTCVTVHATPRATQWPIQTDHIVYQNSGDLWCLTLRNKADVISVPDFLFWALTDCSARASVTWSGRRMTVKYSTLGRPHKVYQAFPEGEIAVISETAKTFSRMFRGYDPAAVDAYIEALTTKQHFLLNDVESLRARLKERDDEAAALRKDVAVLRDTSPSPHAMQHRMAKMLRRAVDEISEMQAEARAEAEALIAATKAEAEAEQRKHKELLADMAAKRNALEAEYEDTKKKLDAELARVRAETQSEIDQAWQDAQQQREQLLADAKQEADFYREQARRAVDEASQQRIKVLEQLMGVYRDLEAVPATLESAYQEAKDSLEASVVVPLDQKISAG